MVLVFYPILTLVALLSVGMSASAARGVTTERMGFAVLDEPPRRRLLEATTARADIDVAAALEANAKDILVGFRFIFFSHPSRLRSSACMSCILMGVF